MLNMSRSFRPASNGLFLSYLISDGVLSLAGISTLEPAGKCFCLSHMISPLSGRINGGARRVKADFSELASSRIGDQAELVTVHPIPNLPLSSYPGGKKGERMYCHQFHVTNFTSPISPWPYPSPSTRQNQSF